MKLGQTLVDLRKKKRLSQEEVAEKLNVTRQTVSKWETDQSTPDFDKIVPLCELYGISADELLTGKKQNQKTQEESLQEEEKRKKKAAGIALSILIYFIAIVWIMITIPVIKMDPIVSSGGFLLICGVATFIIVYTCIVYPSEKKEETKQTKLQKQLESILSIITLIIYLGISFTTGAWYITWLIWVVYGLITEIIKLIIMIRSKEDEE